MRIKDLIKNLKTKDQDAEVEFIICKQTGEIVCMQIEKKASEMAKLLKLFGK